MDKQLSKNFKLSEFFVSDNHPDLAKRAMLERPGYADYRYFMLCRSIIQKIRDFIGCPIIITSGYRDKALNDATPGSSPTSLHMECMAADFTTEDPKDLFMIFEYIKKSLKDVVGEAILYVTKDDGLPKNIHISLPRPGREPKIKIHIRE
jgi:hypothetical protein